VALVARRAAFRANAPVPFMAGLAALRAFAAVPTMLPLPRRAALQALLAVLRPVVPIRSSFATRQTLFAVLRPVVRPRPNLAAQCAVLAVFGPVMALVACRAARRTEAPLPFMMNLPACRAFAVATTVLTLPRRAACRARLAVLRPVVPFLSHTAAL
jgi:hypothetical protein